MMRGPWMHKLGGRLAIVLLGGAAMLLMGAGGAWAVSDYGPPGPPAASVPGGFSDVVTSQTIGPGGGTIGPVSVDGISVTLTVPAGACSGPVQITLTAPDLAAIGNGGFAHHKAVSGVGILIQGTCSSIPGTFLKPFTLTMKGSPVTAASIATVWNGTAFVIVSSATVTAGSATVSFDTDPDFAVLAPTGTATDAIPGATAASTGKPFLGEGILAGLLLLLGAAGLGCARRRRPDGESGTLQRQG